ncbi:hypothetical protein FISHEDRAFT_69283 [Fistulina hepatica ATCC 64428]|uniref:Homeobox domain-containing protein n=1 Tax=Fistulina hepatica ATCC 64428 TaxID=1128425 RepID=A0A0D7AQR4_9AGAR|nr:hypothetical protein FISHEDRAFT_69283 [Fistulina hepatica ATCC 64428]
MSENTPQVLTSAIWRKLSRSEKESHPGICFRALQPAHRRELQQLWAARPCVPTLRSRADWAFARFISPARVHAWFHRRRMLAKKRREPFNAMDGYDMPVGIQSLDIKHELMDVKLEVQDVDICAESPFPAPLPSSSPVFWPVVPCGAAFSTTSSNVVKVEQVDAIILPGSSQTPLNSSQTVAQPPSSSFKKSQLLKRRAYRRKRPMDVASTVLGDTIDVIASPDDIDTRRSSCAAKASSFSTDHLVKREEDVAQPKHPSSRKRKCKQQPIASSQQDIWSTIVTRVPVVPVKTPRRLKLGRISPNFPSSPHILSTSGIQVKQEDPSFSFTNITAITPTKKQRPAKRRKVIAVDENGLPSVPPPALHKSSSKLPFASPAVSVHSNSKLPNNTLTLSFEPALTALPWTVTGGSPVPVEPLHISGIPFLYCFTADPGICDIYASSAAVSPSSHLVDFDGLMFTPDGFIAELEEPPALFSLDSYVSTKDFDIFLSTLRREANLDSSSHSTPRSPVSTHLPLPLPYSHSNQPGWLPSLEECQPNSVVASDDDDFPLRLLVPAVSFHMEA